MAAVGSYSTGDTELVAPKELGAATALAEPAVRVVEDVTVAEGERKFTKVEIVCKEAKFEALKSAMTDIGITGMTVSHVLGCGIQKGKPEYYRGVPVEVTLLPKVRVDIVISKVPVRKVIETAKQVLYTGHIATVKSSSTMWRTWSRFEPVRRVTMPFRM